MRKVYKVLKKLLEFGYFASNVMLVCGFGYLQARSNLHAQRIKMAGILPLPVAIGHALQQGGSTVEVHESKSPETGVESLSPRSPNVVPIVVGEEDGEFLTPLSGKVVKAAQNAELIKTRSVQSGDKITMEWSDKKGVKRLAFEANMTGEGVDIRNKFLRGDPFEASTGSVSGSPVPLVDTLVPSEQEGCTATSQSADELKREAFKKR